MNPEAKQGEAPPGTQAVVRALRLLKAFTPQAPDRTLDQLSAGQGLTRTTTHRLLAALESEGLVARNAALNTYQLGPELIALGSQAMLTSDLRATVRPTLERVSAESDESTTLEVLVGDQMLILDGVKGRHLVSAGLEIGTRWPAHATSTGKSVLAALPESHLDQLLRSRLSRYTEHTLTDPEALRTELQTIRSTGYAVANQELEVDFVAVGAAFRGPFGEVQGAIGVGGPASRFPPRRISVLGRLLSAQASELSRHHPPA
jgi:DNA-binding IclR family transcriptional regulator